MLDIDIEDTLVRKVGGKLKLTSLMQKRMVELKRGARALVDLGKGAPLISIIVEEILQDKIELAPRDEVDTSLLDGVRRIREEKADGEREIYGSDLRKIKEQRIKELSALLNPNKR